MPLLRQLEFAFRTVAGIADPGRFGAPQDAGITAPGYNNAERNLNLEETARDLLRAHSAQSESRTSFASNGIRASKLPLVALITARNSFR